MLKMNLVNECCVKQFMCYSIALKSRRKRFIRFYKILWLLHKNERYFTFHNSCLRGLYKPYSSQNDSYLIKLSLGFIQTQCIITFPTIVIWHFFSFLFVTRFPEVMFTFSFAGYIVNVIKLSGPQFILPDTIVENPIRY